MGHGKERKLFYIASGYAAIKRQPSIKMIHQTQQGARIIIPLFFFFDSTFALELIRC